MPTVEAGGSGSDGADSLPDETWVLDAGPQLASAPARARAPALLSTRRRSKTSSSGVAMRSGISQPRLILISIVRCSSGRRITKPPAAEPTAEWFHNPIL